MSVYAYVLVYIMHSINENRLSRPGHCVIYVLQKVVGINFLSQGDGRQSEWKRILSGRRVCVWAIEIFSRKFVRTVSRIFYPIQSRFVNNMWNTNALCMACVIGSDIQLKIAKNKSFFFDSIRNCPFGWLSHSGLYWPLLYIQYIYVRNDPKRIPLILYPLEELLQSFLFQRI